MILDSYRQGQLEALEEALEDVAGEPEGLVTLCLGKPRCEKDWSGDQEFQPCPFCARIPADDPRSAYQILEDIVDAKPH